MLLSVSNRYPILDGQQSSYLTSFSWSCQRSFRPVLPGTASGERSGRTRREAAGTKPNQTREAKKESTRAAQNLTHQNQVNKARMLHYQPRPIHPATQGQILHMNAQRQEIQEAYTGNLQAGLDVLADTAATTATNPQYFQVHPIGSPDVEREMELEVWRRNVNGNEAPVQCTYASHCTLYALHFTLFMLCYCTCTN